MGPLRAKFRLLGVALCSVACHVAGVQVGQVVWQGGSLEQGEYGSTTGGCQEKGKKGPSYWDWGPKSPAELLLRASSEQPRAGSALVSGTELGVQPPHWGKEEEQGTGPPGHRGLCPAAGTPVPLRKVRFAR